MDQNLIATLKDYQLSLDRSFTNIKTYFTNYNKSDGSQQMTIVKELKREQDSMKNALNLLKMEASSLENEKNQIEWKTKIDKYQSEYDQYKGTIGQLTNKQISDQAKDNQENVKIKDMTVQQTFNKGDKILKEDAKAISRIKNIVNHDYDVMKDTNGKLLHQNEQLGNADYLLTEIDYSLKRSKKYLGNMLRMYATDKFIIMMIVLVVLVIIAIVVCAIIGETKKNDKNPIDIFTWNNTVSQ